jgi:hypothetical protein
MKKLSKIVEDEIGDEEVNDIKYDGKIKVS